MRIVIAEDSALFREGLAALLADAGHDIVARVPDAVSLMDAVHEREPDLAIIDVRMPPDLTDDGARAATVLRRERPELAIVLLSQHVETSHSVQLVGGGRFGYLLKDRVLDVDDFLDALRRVAAGGSALDPEEVSHGVCSPPVASCTASRTRRNNCSTGRPGSRTSLRKAAAKGLCSPAPSAAVARGEVEKATRVAAGGSALDPEVVSRLIGATQADAPMQSLTSRERDVLALMAEGHTNLGIARRLWVSERTVETHVTNVLIKLGLDSTEEGHRRVLAVLKFLESGR